MHAAIRIEPIDRSNWRRAFEVRPRPEQLRFVADHEPVAGVVLAKAFVGYRGLAWEPLAVVADDRVVGLLALAHATEATLLFHLLIDANHQGQGIGRSAVRLAIQKLRTERPASRELSLTVHPENRPAQCLYGSLGFEPTGEVRDDEPVWRLSLRPENAP